MLQIKHMKQNISIYLDWLLSNIVSYKAMLSLPRLTQLAPHRWVGAGHYLNCRLSAKWDKDHHFSPALTLSSLCWVLQTLKNALCVGEHLIDLLFFQAKKSLMQHIHTYYLHNWKNHLSTCVVKIVVCFWRSDKFEMIFSSQPFFQKTNEKIRLYYLSTCFCSFFGRKWRHQKDISKSTDLWLGQPIWPNFTQRFHFIFLGNSVKVKNEAIHDLVFFMHTICSKLVWHHPPTCYWFSCTARHVIIKKLYIKWLKKWKW